MCFFAENDRCSIGWSNFTNLRASGIKGFWTRFFLKSLKISSIVTEISFESSIL